MPTHTGRIYALLVGIDDYDPAVGKLRGCVNDADHYTDWLRERFAPERLCLEVLKDGDATRTQIVETFRSHLGRAGAGDVALFQYSGHGARWKSAAAFARFYPDGMDEGLVCFDSRGPGGFDLADKELAVLLAEVAHKEPHMAVLLDCCHSGSGTRCADDFTQARTRVTHQRNDERPLESYLDGYYASRDAQGESLSIPVSRHILLAACERVQKAWEGRDHRGVFSTSLLDVLASTGADVTYAELFQRVRSAVKRYADNQTPQFETYLGFDAYQGFLGGAATALGRGYPVYFDTGVWKVDCGALHGLPTDPDKPAELALYPETDRETPAGRAEVIQVGAQRSLVKLLDLDADPEWQFQARITSLPVPPLLVGLEADAETCGAVQQAFANADRDALGFALVAEPGPTIRYGLALRDGALWFLERETGRLIEGDESAPPKAAARLFRSITQVADWERLVQLDNGQTRMDRSAVDFRFVEVDEDGQERPFENDPVDITMDYRQVDDDWRRVVGRLVTGNRTGQVLHLALALFTDDFSILVPYNERIEPTDDPVAVMVGGDDTFDLFLDEGVDEATFVFKLIVSTERIDGFLLEQEGLDIGRCYRSDEKGLRGIAFGKDRHKPAHRDEWFTKTIRVRLVRRLDRVSSQDLSFAGGHIRIKGHPQLTADVSLGTAQSGSRAAGAPADFYHALEREGLELAGLSATRGTPVNTLELTGIDNAGAIDVQPLEIELDLGLAEDEHLLPLTFDGMHMLLAGETDQGDDGRTLVRIDHIPDGIPDNRRALGKALKLYFFKTYLKRDVNRLCWVEYGANGSVQQHEDGVADKVAAAHDILLLVHGIIGDTEGIAASLPQAVDTHGRSIASRFDLVLTYDYENLGTEIEDTARRLKSKLREAGLHEHDDKRLTLLVHSMGGLVSRWLIEQEGGSRFVDHLVMCGTPNAGSPFGMIDAARNLMAVLTTWAMNSLPAFAPFGAGLLTVLARSRKLSPTLEQMNPKSGFIRELNAGDDPGVRYSILAGDIRDFEETSGGLVATLTEKIGKGALFDALYRNEGHDIAVALESIEGVPEPREPAPARREVACHHLNYFASDAGLEGLASIDW
jgi:pimeloyl-ACP methyl ester carboxylesterase